MESSQSLKKFSLFETPFRAFFLLGSVFLIASLNKWFLYLTGSITWSSKIPPFQWHSHEMVFGFSLAIIAGFLLTAVQNWTGVPCIKRKPLILLVGLWGLGRLFFWFSSSINFYALLIPDSLFLIFTLGWYCYSILKAKNYRNLIFVPILASFLVLHIYYCLALLNMQVLAMSGAMYSGVLLTVLVISVVAGRVFSFFTVARLGGTKILEPGWAFVALNLPLVALALLPLLGLLNSLAFNLLVLLSGIGQTVRVIRWWRKDLLQEPLLWSLYFSYGFLAIGFMLWSLLYSVSGMSSQIFHLIAIGCVGGVIFSMICRISLGHSGNSLKVKKVITLAFGFVFISAFARTILPLLNPELTQLTYWVSTLSLAIAFTFFVIVYFPILIGPRADNRPG